MVFLKDCAPAGVVDDDVEKDPRTERMGGGGEFAKLVKAGGPVIEFNERRVDRRQIERGIRTAKAPEPRIGGRCGVHRQQMQNAATERLDDVRQLAREVAKFAGRRNDGIICESSGLR